MLLKDFYSTISLETKHAGNYQAIIRVNGNHEVFSGHFPGNPIMPGVCMMQIIKELTMQITGKNLLIQSLSNVKFMALINPELTPELRLEIDLSDTEEGLIKVKNTTWFGETVALKLNCTYKQN